MNKKHRLVSILAMYAILAARPASSEIIVLTFEGLGHGNPVENFYNGGSGGNYGITFSSNALALVDSDAGGEGNFGGEPSPDTVLFFLRGDAATMSVAGGFSDGFSFFYSAINTPGSVTVFDEAGQVLASRDLETTAYNGEPDPTGEFSPFVAVGVSFSGLAFSVEFAGAVNQIGFDNITFGSAIPVPGIPSDVNNPGTPPDTNPKPVPDAGSTVALMGLGLLGMAYLRRNAR